MKSLSDSELMAIVQSGDLSPAGEIYDRYSRQVFNFTYRMVRNKELAEDATQETFVKLIKHANQFHREAKLKTWLFSIAANWCRDHFRRLENRAPRLTDEILTTVAAADEIAQIDSARDIQRLLDRMPEDHRNVILLARFHGLSYPELAKVCGCSEAAMKTRVFRAMEILKKLAAGDQEGGKQCLTAI